MSTEYSSMTVDGLKSMYSHFLAMTDDQRYAAAKESGLFEKYEKAEVEFCQYDNPETPSFILTHVECGGFGKDFNSAARVMLGGQERARKNLRKQLDWRKDNPGVTPPADAPYKNLTNKSVLMLDLLWPCTLHGGKEHWEAHCLRIRNMLGYSNMLPAPAPPPARLIPTREDPEERTMSAPVHAAVALATIPEANQEDILVRPDAPEGTTMPLPATVEPPAETAKTRRRNPVFVVLEQCDGDKKMQSMVRKLCSMSKADRDKLLAYLNAAPA